MTDVRVWNHQARTLHIAVWLHRLDMALSEEPAASGSLVWARHSLESLLAYFLGPRTAWSLQFEDIIDQVLRENQRHDDKKCTAATSSLQKCRNRQTKLRNEFDVMSKAMEVITDAPSCREMEHRLNTLQTSLSTVERSIVMFENLIEDCQMLEEEVHHVEEDKAHWKRRSARRRRRRSTRRRRRRRSPMLRWPKRKSAVILSPLAPRGEADTEGPLHWSPLRMLSPQRRMLSSCSQHPNPKIQRLDLTAPGARPARSQERWPNYA